MYAGGKLYASRIETLSLKANSVRSLSEKMSKIDPLDRVVPPEITNDFALEELEIAKGLAANPPATPWANASEGPLWSFSPREEYIWDTRDRELGELPETLTQQFLRVDVTDDPWGGPGFDTWTLNSRPSGGLRMGTNGGFGSWETLYQPDTSDGSSLREPSTVDPKDIPALKLTWTGSGRMKIKTLKRS
jgi:hypothetical protein